MDPARRLHRQIVGASLSKEPVLVTRMLDRLDAEVRPPLVPERNRETRTGTIRANGRTADAAPNAPQLFRLVRHPFSLGVVRPVRKEGVDRSRVERARETVVVQAARQPIGIRAARRDPAVDSFNRRPQPAPRISADSWIESAGVRP